MPMHASSGKTFGHQNPQKAKKSAVVENKPTHLNMENHWVHSKHERRFAMNGWKRKWTAIGWGIVLAIGLTLTPASAAELPKLMTWTAYDVGSSGYLQVGFISESLWEKYKIKVRVIPAGTDLPRVYPLRLRDAQVAFHGIGSYFMQEGLFDYSTMDWGPQPVRVLYLAQHPGLVLGVRGDSGIKKAADLRGKRVAAFPSYALTLISEVTMAFGGLTWKDVQKVNCPAYATAIKMIMEGKIDTSHVNPTAALAYEFHAMPYGLRYIPLPRADKAGWARVKKHAPFYSPMKVSIGAGLSKEKPLEGTTYAYPVALAYDFLPANQAYIVTKLLHEAFPLYSKKHKSLAAYWPLEHFLELFEGYPVPLHEGTVRYLKEIGKWTPEYEKINQERLKHQAEIRKVFEGVKAEALEKKMAAKKFPKFWLEKRKAAGF